MAGVTWERVEDGIYRRDGAGGRPIYRAVRQAGKDPETGKYAQEVRTFNGAKTQNALKEARLWRADGVVQLERGPTTVNASAKRTLREGFDYLHTYREYPYAPATLEIHDQAWRALMKADSRLADRRLKDLDKQTLRAALMKIEAPKMRDKVRVLVHAIYEHLEVEPNPATKQRKERTRAARVAQQGVKGRYLEDGAVLRLIVAVPDRYKTLVRLLWRVGPRPGEAFALTIGQYDAGSREVTIDRAVNRGVVSLTKTGAARKIVLPVTVAADLDEHIRRFSDFTDPEALVFTTDSGAPIDLHNWRARVWARAARVAGIEGANPYDLRHTACSNAVAAGVDLVTVAGMAGHNVQVLVSTYAHEVERAKLEAADKLDALIRGEEVAIPAV